MKPVILFRASLAEEDELEIARKYFRVVKSRMDIKPDELVIPRYSALPYYEELENDVEAVGGMLINSYNHHRYVAHLPYWYHSVSDFTPKTFFRFADADSDGTYPFVLKGTTNSRKNLWKTHMFASNKEEMEKVWENLLNDSMIGEQEIVFREYEKFKSYGVAIGDLPITKEFRIFMYGDKVLARGFYWASHPEVIEEHKPDTNEIPDELINSISAAVKGHINFWVMDVAQREDGVWRLVELNDGQMSGLSCVNSDELYSNLAKVLDDEQNDLSNI